MLFNYKYLGKEVTKGFDAYKYSSQDTSPFSKYVMHPFWNWLVEFLPRTLAPNLMTLSGFLCLVGSSLLLIYFDPELYASSIEHPEHPPVPNWVWLLCAVLTFLSHTLDGMDGKQARRTGNSSCVGELFDHGLDSWATLFFPMTIYSVFGRGRYGGNPVRVYYLFVAVMGQFVLSHWEKYVTGMFFLPWGYDISQVGLTLLYIFTFCVGAGFWQTYAIADWTHADVLLLFVYFVFWTLCVPLTLYNVYDSYAQKTGRGLSLTECWLPLVSPSVLLAASGVWIHHSPNDIVMANPRLFYTAFGTAFSSIACRLIVSQMSSTRCQLLNPLTAVYSLFAAGVLLLQPSFEQEFAALCLLVLLTVAMHVHYGSCVVSQMLDHFGLRAFVIQDRSKAN